MSKQRTIGRLAYNLYRDSGKSWSYVSRELSYSETYLRKCSKLYAKEKELNWPPLRRGDPRVGDGRVARLYDMSDLPEMTAQTLPDEQTEEPSSLEIGDPSETLEHLLWALDEVLK